MVSIPKCACGCGQQVGSKPLRGPAPVYASAACRKRAMRRRNATAELTPLPDRPEPLIEPASFGSVDEQVARAVMETRAIAFALTRLGTLARPEFAWRCAKLGEAIETELNRAFGEAMK